MDPDWYDSFELFPGWHHFTGDFAVYDIDGALRYHTYMIDGKSQKKSSSGRIAGVSACSNNSRIAGWVCTTTTWLICKTAGGESNCYFETDTDCTWMEDCEDSGGSPDSGPTYDPGYTGGGSSADPAKTCPPNYEMLKGRCVPTCKSNDGGECVECDDGMVYNEKLSRCVEESELWEEGICEKDNFRNNDCVYGIWETMKEMNVGYETLKRFLGDQPMASLCLDIKNLKSSANGNTDPGVLLNGEITINLNSTKLNRSKLSIARTILHEMIHAELFSMVVEAGGYDHFRNYANSYQGEDPFKVIWQYYETYGEYIDDVNPGWQHEYMADHYIQYMADGLKKLHSSLSSQGCIDYWEGGQFELIGYNKMIMWNWDNFFEAMAWEGLMSGSKKGSTFTISAWEKLSPEEKQLKQQYQSYNYESNKCN